MQLEREERNKRRSMKEESINAETTMSAAKKTSLTDSIHSDDLDESQDSNNSANAGGGGVGSGGTRKLLATDCDDPATTNIFISNLSPKVSQK